MIFTKLVLIELIIEVFLNEKSLILYGSIFIFKYKSLISPSNDLLILISNILISSSHLDLLP